MVQIVVGNNYRYTYKATTISVKDKERRRYIMAEVARYQLERAECAYKYHHGANS